MIHSNIAPHQMERLSFTVEEAVGASGIPRTSFYAAIARGEVRTFKLGRRRFVSVEALREFITSLERKSAPKAAA